MATTKHNISFIHPDLGIGGAERLVIDAAVGLQTLGHSVTVFTSHCDPNHCFDEARNGTLDVRVRGNTIVPRTILGRFSILCAILRQLHLVYLISVKKPEPEDCKTSVIFVDQLSACIPLVRFLKPDARIIFYCHFPDKLLAKKGGLLKSLYRVPFDWLESWSTGCSDAIVVNSKFTRSIFADAFPALSDRRPSVVYPCVDTQNSALAGNKDSNFEPQAMWASKKVLLSINRYEMKKNIALAVDAFARLSDDERRDSRLVIAGGFDPRVRENQDTYSSLCALADSHGLKHATAKTVISAMSIPDEISVLFLQSVPDAFKVTLLKTARMLVYTPLHEHFGIVPLEAMLAETPVLAANEGGPTETVVEGVTGWLRDVRAVDEWTRVMRKCLGNGEEDRKMLAKIGARGRERVVGEFSKRKMALRLDEEIGSMMLVARPRVVTTPIALALLGFVGLALSLLCVYLYK